jgi:hypothetical protein
MAVKAVHTLSCPSCGGRLTYAPGRVAVTCAWCGSTVFVPEATATPKPFAPEPEPLATRVAQLVQAGHDGRAVQLLREELALSLESAGQTVERIRMSEGKDVDRVIRQAREGKPPAA